MNNKSSITDWIQSIAVVLALLLGFWEFVVRVYILDWPKKEKVYELIVAEQQMVRNSVYQEFQNNYGLYLDDKTKEHFKDYVIKSDVVMKNYAAWAACYATYLCDKKNTLDHVCRDFVKFDKNRDTIHKNNGENPYHTKWYEELLDACKN